MPGTAALTECAQIPMRRKEGIISFAKIDPFGLSRIIERARASARARARASASARASARGRARARQTECV